MPSLPVGFHPEAIAEAFVIRGEPDTSVSRIEGAP
jgi:hypothetical protein